MTRITRITLSYVAAEDRIGVAAKLVDGRAVRLWLTQRIARSLATALARHLEKAGRNSWPGAPDAAPAQTRATPVSTIGASRVATDSTGSGHLVRNIEVALSAERVVLKFASDLDFRPAVVLTRDLVRQWLGMLHRRFVDAGWPLDVWPAWVDDAPRIPASVTRH